MLNQNVPPPAQVGEISAADIKRQQWEDNLTRSNWRFFMQTKDESPNPGSDRRDSGGKPNR
jgi:hypothetical protein